MKKLTESEFLNLLKKPGLWEWAWTNDYEITWETKLSGVTKILMVRERRRGGALFARLYGVEVVADHDGRTLKTHEINELVKEHTPQAFFRSHTASTDDLVPPSKRGIQVERGALDDIPLVELVGWLTGHGLELVGGTRGLVIRRRVK